MEFSELKTVVDEQFRRMKKNTLFLVDVNKDDLWDKYLNSFPEGTNPIYKERTEHDCQCCKGFIRDVGAVVSIEDNKLVSIWDVAVGGGYQVVADELSKMVKSCAIKGKFYHHSPTAGADKTIQVLDSGTISWSHFYGEIPANLVAENYEAKIATSRENISVLKRSINLISIDSIETVLDLISENSLYRGEEHATSLAAFRGLLEGHHDAKDKDVYLWEKDVPAGLCRIKNTSIGTLLGAISSGTELESAVKAYEAMVAPSNYKRPKAIVTRAMISRAKEKVAELGFDAALKRRFAKPTDISVNNVIFADRSAKKQMIGGDVFDELIEETPDAKMPKNATEIDVKDFISKVVPNASAIDLLLENSHEPNMFSLIAPEDGEAKTMFKWPNNFSWSYNGNIADSMKQRVKAAGGDVSGDFRASLSWDYTDDLDIHLVLPNSRKISFSYPRIGEGVLDVDMNASAPYSTSPVENITYKRRRDMPEGEYKLLVNNFCRRSMGKGFVAEIEFDGIVHTFEYGKAIASHGDVAVATFNYTHKDGLKIISSLPSSASSKQIWGVPTQTFHRVSMIMNSPNHWDGNSIGNRHYFFALSGCKNDNEARGFFNEFLNESLSEHRKVFEVIGSKMSVKKDDDQISGVGFSSTKRHSAMVKVSGDRPRMYKVNF